MLKKIMTCAFVLSLAAGSSYAMDHSMKDMPQTTQKMSSGIVDQEGKMVHSEKVEGYTLTFYLIDMNKKMAEIKASGNTKMAMMDMGPMKSHHLMMYVLDQNGQKVSDAKIGYMVTAPDGAKQKTMTMKMSGGYGADVELKTAGTYAIMTKALVQGKKIINTFELSI